MIGELIMLPVRIGVRATRLWLRAAEETVTVATSVTGRVIAATTGRSCDASARGGSATAPAPESRAGASARAGFSPSAPGTSASVSSAELDTSARPSTSRAPAERRGAGAAATPDGSPARAAPSPGTPDRAPEPAPPHVSSEPALVEEFAEPGAEEGAGAEVHIDAPWDGYDHMNAKQVIARLGDASPAELAAVQLYENSKRRRQTILNAVQRELRSNGGSSRSR